ncbi:MAG: 4a-hydroxytetrahydrobiopterin dehydratase [Gemmatimonadales bacterium]|nr:MAG: 4a-hydroxytetrahydrobiopterin dehydratase [Gemmatimonadales bacterium]
MTMDLLSRHCQPLGEDALPLEGEALDHYTEAIPDRWKVVDGHHLEGTFEFENFVEALEFTNAAGEVAEEENHHPEITVTWGRATVRIWTHDIDGLSENDFILAARIDARAR